MKTTRFSTFLGFFYNDFIFIKCLLFVYESSKLNIYENKRRLVVEINNNLFMF